MSHFSDAAGRMVASDLAAAFTSFDNTILDTARLTVSMMEGKANSRLHPAKAQRVMDAVATSLARVVEGRKEMVSAHLSLIAIKGESNQRETDYGCTTGPLMTEQGDPISSAQPTMPLLKPVRDVLTDA
jgi:hypothetical protein